MISFDFVCESGFKPSVSHKIWLQQVIRKEGKVPGDIAYIFCDDDYMLERNVAFLNHDTYTDIITFDECVGNIVAGSILISLDRVGENAEAFGKSFENEFLRVLVHGTLHLCGYKDKTEDEAKTMRQKEDESLALLAH
ncbi:MAG: rRNA maturation RNase YbeY [Bacteroidales bacterium]|jgi:rRNA maturation RNase YbeY|nr:rRNA maturation RNase YbeY [Bacteroidales bacterium]